MKETFQHKDLTTKCGPRWPGWSWHRAGGCRQLEAYARTTLLRRFLDDNRRVWRRREWCSPEPSQHMASAEDPTVDPTDLAALS